MQTNGKVKRYIELNGKYINDAEECLKKGDYAQASEKLWGATVTIAKAIAAQRRKTIKTHEGIGAFLAQIARELKDESISNVYFTAEALHQNFYENVAPPDFVKKGAKTVKQFVTRMRNRFDLSKL
ncbi:MAG TPA: PaREP1 family protein [Candidatus Brocadiales bacterium]|nr:PaREP1 family protein [Candidatus Brocadiales bacterium]